ncbi:MAG: protein of unknown function DUF177 [Magnetococcales bacterium]|nr:protein of unknown function DUF177 [Magnetococcales bacterium]HIJ85038.1 DUF177 domain-containing protein [Magnetococcales bacterium]
MELDGLTLQLDAKSYREKHVSGYVSCEYLPLLEDSLAASHPVHVDVAIARANDKWRVFGTLMYRVQGTCCRCLELFHGEQTSQVERLFCVGPDPFQDKKNKAMEDDLTYLEGGDLVIRDLVQEEILLDLPMTPVCSDDCRGLCPQCGVNRNRERCHCESKTREGPFSELKKLKLS